MTTLLSSGLGLVSTPLTPGWNQSQPSSLAVIGSVTSATPRQLVVIYQGGPPNLPALAPVQLVVWSQDQDGNWSRDLPFTLGVGGPTSAKVLGCCPAARVVYANWPKLIPVVLPYAPAGSFAAPPPPPPTLLPARVTLVLGFAGPDEPPAGSYEFSAQGVV